MSDKTPNNAQTQRDTFNQLVDDGTYSAEFEHPAEMKRFVASVVREHQPCANGRRAVHVLECGCGTGFWLQLACEILRDAGRNARPMGFDISDRMVALARRVLGKAADDQDLRQGDLLAPGVFKFRGCEDGFDMILAYDVIQQLPPTRQPETCRRIAGRLAVGGVAMIFDQDGDSAFGRRMRIKKMLRRYLGIPLVPAYYCNATYPKLSEIQRQLTLADGISAEIIAAPDSPKYALVIRRH